MDKAALESFNRLLGHTGVMFSSYVYEAQRTLEMLATMPLPAGLEHRTKLLEQRRGVAQKHRLYIEALDMVTRAIPRE